MTVLGRWVLSFVLVAMLLLPAVMADSTTDLILQMMLTGASNTYTANAAGGGGSNNTIQPVCSNPTGADGSTACIGNDPTIIYACKGGQWIPLTMCQPGMECQNGICAPTAANRCSSPPGNSGEVKCLPNDPGSVYVCQNGQWNVQQSCGAGQTCQNGVCSGCDNPLANNGATACIGSDPSIVYTCQGGTWSPTKMCPVGEQCQNGACASTASNDCTGPSGQPNEVRCLASDPNSVFTCSNGEWTVSKSCDQNYICVSGKCQYDPAVSSCDPKTDGGYCTGNSQRTYCGNDGHWRTETCSMGCQNGICKSSGSGSGSSGNSGNGGGTLPENHSNATVGTCTANPSDTRSETEQVGSMCRSCTTTSYGYSCPNGVNPPASPPAQTKECGSWNACAPQSAASGVQPAGAAGNAVSNPAPQTTTQSLLDQYGWLPFVGAGVVVLVILWLGFKTFGKKPDQ